MTKYTLAGALACFALTSTAQSVDSIAVSTELQEIEVKAKSRLAGADRNVIRPPKEAVSASVNGRDLIGRLRIPRISVNPLTGEVGMSGGGTVGITINGVVSTSSELAAIPPEDIIKVEHIGNPGPRYPDFDVVLNVVTRRHTSGGNVGADLLNAFKKGGEADIDNLALTYSNGKSQWSYSGQWMRVMRDNWARDYSETRILPSGTLKITEIGRPSKMEVANLDNFLTYSLADERRYLFNAKMGFAITHSPYSEEADRTTTRLTSDGSDPTEVYEHMGERSSSPSLDLYGQLRLDNGDCVSLNVVGTYIRSHNTHIYRRTSESGELLEDIRSDIAGSKYSLISEAAYTRQTGIHRINAGVRHFQSYANNSYAGDVAATVDIRQAQTALYGQYSVALDNANLMGSVGVSRFADSQSGARQARWIFTPSIAASWTPLDGLALRYKAQLQGKTPSLAELSDVAQTIDPGYLRRGNPELRAFRVLDHQFSAGWEWRWLSIDLSVPMSHEFNPVMESVIRENGVFVRTYYNQRSFTHIGAEASVSIRPWGDYIIISLTPSIDRYTARGIDYSCSHTLHNLRIDAELNWRNWQLSYNTFTGYANYMYGTRLMRERNMSMITFGFKTDRYAFKIGVLDPFIRKYWMETLDFAPLLSSVSKAYSTRPTYFVAQISINLDFGRRTERREIDIENSDTDGGLLRGVK